MRRWLLACALTLGSTACTTGENVRMSIRDGETREQVERTLGRPDGYQRQGNTEALIYANRLLSGWSGIAQTM